MLIPFQHIISKYNVKPNGIIHIGAWDGGEMYDYTSEGIERVIFIEAQQAIMPTLRGRVKPYDTQAMALNYCLSNKTGMVDFMITNNGQSSSILNLKDHKAQHPEVVETQRIPMMAYTYVDMVRLECIPTKDYDFLNMDVQGAELLVLQGMSDLISAFKAIYLEVNEIELYEGCALLPQVDEYLTLHGFTRVEIKMTSHGWGDAFYIKNL
jgi:FkbM family methyltransferase